MEWYEKSIEFLPLKHLSSQNHWVVGRLGAEAYLRLHYFTDCSVHILRNNVQLTVMASGNSPND